MAARADVPRAPVSGLGEIRGLTFLEQGVRWRRSCLSTNQDRAGRWSASALPAWDGHRHRPLL